MNLFPQKRENLLTKGRTTTTTEKCQFYLSGLPNLRFQLRKQIFRLSHSQCKVLTILFKQIYSYQFTRFSPEKYSIHSI